LLNIDPRQFLVPDAPSPAVRSKEQERLALMALQREAEAACPLPQETIQPNSKFASSTKRICRNRKRV